MNKINFNKVIKTRNGLRMIVELAKSSSLRDKSLISVVDELKTKPCFI